MDEDFLQKINQLHIKQRYGRINCVDEIGSEREMGSDSEEKKVNTSEIILLQMVLALDEGNK